MAFFTWVVVAFLAGVLAFFGVPLVLGPVLPKRLQRALSSRFFWLSMQALGRGGLVRRIHGGWDLVRSKFDGEKTAERVELAGEERYFKDPYNFMTRFKNKPFFLAYERYNSIVDPRIAEIGERLDEIRESGEYKMERVAETEDGEPFKQRFYAKHFRLPGATRVVELAKTPISLMGGSKPEDPKTTEEWAKASQSGFRDSRTWDYIQILTAYAVPVILMWFIQNYGNTSAPNVDAPTVGLVLGVLV